MTEIQQLFITNLKRHRMRLGLTQAKLAEICDVSASYVGEMESGRKFPSAETLQSISEAMNVRPYQLFADEGDLLKNIEPELFHRFTEFLKLKIGDAVAEAQDEFSQSPE